MLRGRRLLTRCMRPSLHGHRGPTCISPLRSERQIPPLNSEGTRRQFACGNGVTATFASMWW